MSLLTWTQHCKRCEWNQSTLNIEMNDCFCFYSARIFLYKTFLNINVKKTNFFKDTSLCLGGNSILGFHCLGGVTRLVIHLKMVVEILCLGSHPALQVVKNIHWGKV